jgi:pyocin large subunit-like protein
MASTKVLMGVFAASVLVLSACERNAAETEAARVENTAPAAPSPDAEDRAPARAEARSERAGAARSERADDPREGPQPTHDDGAPLWAANRNNTAEAAAQRQFQRNGETFGADTVDEYVDRAHAFIANPPAGTEKATRASNGDRLFYDAKSNTFVVATRDGAPRTMFKPDDGAAYWTKQKQQAAQRRGGRDDQG